MSEENLIKYYAFVFFLVFKCFAISTDQNDLMNGNGLFLSQSIAAYSLNGHTYTFITSNNSNVLRLQKPSGNQISFQKGLSQSFTATKVKHIQFKFSSTSTDVEDSNLRLADSNGLTLVLFRAGRGGLIRVNQKQMISFYNESLSTDSDIKLTQIDLKIDWESKTIEVFVNQKYKDVCKFFDQSVGPVNKILIYNLYSSVSYWSNIVVCKQICYGFNWQNTTIATIFLSIIMIISIL